MRCRVRPKYGFYPSEILFGRHTVIGPSKRLLPIADHCEDEILRSSEGCSTKTSHGRSWNLVIGLWWKTSGGRTGEQEHFQVPSLQWRLLSDPPKSKPATAKGSLNQWMTSIHPCINTEMKTKQHLLPSDQTTNYSEGETTASYQHVMYKPRTSAFETVIAPKSSTDLCSWGKRGWVRLELSSPP